MEKQIVFFWLLVGAAVTVAPWFGAHLLVRKITGKTL